MRLNLGKVKSTQCCHSPGSGEGSRDVCRGIAMSFCWSLFCKLACLLLCIKTKNKTSSLQYVLLSCSWRQNSIVKYWHGILLLLSLFMPLKRRTLTSIWLSQQIYLRNFVSVPHSRHQLLLLEAKQTFYTITQCPLLYQFWVLYARFLHQCRQVSLWCHLCQRLRTRTRPICLWRSLIHLWLLLVHHNYQWQYKCPVQVGLFLILPS